MKCEKNLIISKILQQKSRPIVGNRLQDCVTFLWTHGMFGVFEIADAIADEFRHILQDLDIDRLLALKDDQRALRQMLPAGLSHGEARAMIDGILKHQN